jgi:hypothetical protein
VARTCWWNIDIEGSDERLKAHISELLQLKVAFVVTPGFPMQLRS